jgi:signal transduction histidine kinase/CheY-like chemotaxis protein
MDKSKSKYVKQIVITGYILLFLVGAISIGFLYFEILKANKPNTEKVTKNQQLLDLSDALATLYKAESSGRNSDFIISEKGFSMYNQLIDSAVYTMKRIKRNDHSDYDVKLDSISYLLAQKKTSIAKIRVLNHQYNNESNFTAVKYKLLKARDSLRKSMKKVDLTKSTRAVAREFGEYMSEILTEKELDSLSRPFVSDAELMASYDKTLSELIEREDKLRNELKLRESELQAENRILSGKIQVLLNSLEGEILNKSYVEIAESQDNMKRTTLVLLWAGVIGVCLLILFGYIILRDLTRQQNYRSQLEKLNLENDMLLRSKTMLLATVTHDLQSPLGSIIGFSDLLKKTPLNTTQQQYVSNISNSSEYILNLVNDLVDFSKLENNRIKIQNVPFNPKKLIETTFNSLKQNALDKDILILYDVDEKLDRKVISDPYRVKQILTNLVTNAIKFTQIGHVKISCRKENNQILFEIQDTGIGISQEKQSLIFEEFTQAHPDIEKQFGGTGLGLTISKRMVEMLGGKIWVESEFGVGSIFRFSVPYVEEEIEIKSDENEEIDTSYLEGKKILVVDDDKMQLTLMEALFENYPVELKTLNDATQVIALLEKEKYDLVFTDIQMPKKSGFRLAEKIRRHPLPKVNDIPLVALSGKRDLTLEDFTDKGFTYFIEKPIQMRDMLVVMDYIFKGKIAPQPVINKTQEEYITEDKLYDLASLKQFTGEDESALQNIIKLFIDTNYQNIHELKANVDDMDKVAQTAHRMIPMLKQIHSSEIVALLEKLEDKKINESDIDKFIEGLVKKIEKLLKELSNYIQVHEQ